MEFERLSGKQKKWLIDTAKKLDLSIQELTEFLINNEPHGAEFWREFGKLESRASDAIFAHIAAKHKINKTYNTEEFTKELRCLKHSIAIRIAEETGFTIEDWILDEEEHEWCIS